MKKYKIAYIDEADDDIRAFQRFAFKDFEISSIKPVSDLNEMVQKIFNEKPDAIVVDFRLYDEDPSIHYDGNDLVDLIFQDRPEFPVFILTSFENSAIDEVEDVNIVYEKKLMFEKDEKFLLRVKNQIEKYHNKLKDKEEQLIELIEKQNTGNITDKEIEKMLELDDFLERSLSSKSKIPTGWKKPEGFEQLKNLVTKTEEILKEIKKRNG